MPSLRPPQSSDNSRGPIFRGEGGQVTSLMRALSPTLRHPPSHDGRANGWAFHHHPLAALESRGINDAKSNRPSRARKHAAPMPRKPTPRQVALWEALQEANALDTSNKPEFWYRRGVFAVPLESPRI